MSGRLPEIEVGEFERRVRAECESGVPLGAYASSDGVHYVFLGARGCLCARAPVR